MKEKVEARMTRVLGRNGRRGLKAVEEMSALGKKYRELADEAEAEDTLDSEGMDARLDTLADARAKDEVTKAIKRVKPGYRFERLQEELDKFVNLNPIGTKEHKEARDFVTDTFEDMADELDEKIRDLTGDSSFDDRKVILQRAMLSMTMSRVAAHFETLEEEEEDEEERAAA